MRAVLVNNQKSGAEKLYIGEVDTPSPENSQVLVKVIRGMLVYGYGALIFRIDMCFRAQSNGYSVCPPLRMSDKPIDT